MNRANAEVIARFELWHRAGIALGIEGVLLGWTPLVQNAIRRGAMHGLAAYRTRHSS